MLSILLSSFINQHINLKKKTLHILDIMDHSILQGSFSAPWICRMCNICKYLCIL